MKIRFNINKCRDGAGLSTQSVNFFYGYNGEVNKNSTSPQKKPYIGEDGSLISEVEDSLLVALNYENGGRINGQTVGFPSGLTTGKAASFQKISVYKREIWEGGGEGAYSPVLIESPTNGFSDYNISNNRTYEYIIYPELVLAEGAEIRGTVTTNWQNWSLTELHPVSGEKNYYTASDGDVWIFKYNVEPSEQTQNFSKTQQDNLTAYPKFSHGPKNNISSSITALLGSEMVPYDFVNGKFEGGYVERSPFIARLTSNQKIDMLNAWRKVAYSGNPKIIKDRKGQKFLVQITGSSNTTQDTWNSQPDTISFSWVEVGTLKEVMITSKIS